MRIAINAVAVEGGGCRTYLSSILNALQAVSKNHDFLVILAERNRALAALLPRDVQVVVCRGVPRQAGLRMLWEQTVLPFLLCRWKIDLLYAAFDTAALLSPMPIVLLAHDPSPYSRLSLPLSVYARARKVVMHTLGILSARVARRTIYVTHAAAKVMAPQMGVPSHRVRVIYHGVSRHEDGRAESYLPVSSLPRKYILTVADLMPHKNLEVLLQAYQEFLASEQYSGDLVVAGPQRGLASGYAARLMGLRGHLACSDRIHFVGNIPHPDIFSVYRAADLFVFPSLVETFGLPLLEAMSSGVPVICSDWRLAPGGEDGHFNVGPELCQDAAGFFDPTSPSSLAAAMKRVLSNPERGDELKRRGELRAKEFSWEKAAAELLDVFEEAVAQR